MTGSRPVQILLESCDTLAARLEVVGSLTITLGQSFNRCAAPLSAQLSSRHTTLHLDFWPAA